MKLSAIETIIMTEAILFGIAGTQPVAAQSRDPAGARLMFEVASIKLSDPANPNGSAGSDPSGRFWAENTTVSTLIGQAYAHKLRQMSGGPDWLDRARYDVVAKSEESLNIDDPHLTQSQRQAFYDRQTLRLQSMLADRFQLRFHIAAKEMSVYALVVTKNGPKLAVTKNGDDPAGSLTVRPGMIVGHGISISSFAANLGNVVDREVVDKTGLIGLYDIELHCTSERAQMAPGDSGADSGAPSIFVALRQLGLKLEPDKTQGKVLIIDRVERPSEN